MDTGSRRAMRRSSQIRADRLKRCVVGVFALTAFLVSNVPIHIEAAVSSFPELQSEIASLQDQIKRAETLLEQVTALGQVGGTIDIAALQKQIIELQTMLRALQLQAGKIAPPSADTDGDGLNDSEESLYGTNPGDSDSDNDGYLDGIEVQSGYDPLKGNGARLVSPVVPPISTNTNQSQSTSVVRLPRTLQLGDTGEDVRQLQIFLNQNPATQIAATGPGSPGNETTYFGPATKLAVIAFQNLHAAEILIPAGIATGTGIAGIGTRNFIASQTSAIVISPVSPPGPIVVVSPSGGSVGSGGGGSAPAPSSGTESSISTSPSSGSGSSGGGGGGGGGSVSSPTSQTPSSSVTPPADTSGTVAGTTVLPPLSFADETTTIKAPKFFDGDDVEVTGVVNVRETPSVTGQVVGQVDPGTVGVIVGDSVSADGYLWWDIDYPILSGWSIEDSLVGAVMSSGTASVWNILAKRVRPTGTVPGNVAATALSDTQIKISWNNVSSERGFFLRRSLSPTTGYTGVATLGPDTLSYIDSELLPSKKYYYQVKAVYSSGSSAYSDPVSATTQSAPSVEPIITIPAIPTNLTATTISTSEIRLAWGDTTNEDSFVIERSTSATTGFVQIANPAANTVTYANTGLAAATTYYYRIKARNSSGDSGYSTVVSAPTLTPAPGVPTGLTATAVSASQINLSWTAVSKATSYKVERSLSAAEGFVQIAAPTTNSYSNTGLAAATTYYYRVRATNIGGDSAFSSVVNITTQSVAPPADTQAPSAPTNLSGSAVSASQINLSWTASTDNVAVTGYRIYRNSTQVGTTAATVTSYSDTGLTAATIYSYTVRAVDAAGIVSNTSNQVNVTTQSAPVVSFVAGDRVQVISGPLNVRATPSTGGTLLGTQPSGALGTVIAGPTVADGYTWYNINYDTATDGWSVENYLVKTTTPSPIVTYSITASAGANGSISPSGLVQVNSGASQTFTITPNTGYQISGVTVDGTSVGIVPTYTFGNVTVNHTISASFSATSPVSGTYPVSVANATWNARAVWDLQLPGAVGPTQAPTKRVGVNALPCGRSTATHLYIEGAACNGSIWSGWDLTGRAIKVDAQNVTITDSIIKANGVADYPVQIGLSSSGSSLTINKTTVDGLNADQRFGAMVLVVNSSIVTITGSRFTNSPTAHIVATSQGSMDIRRNVFEAPGARANVGAHTEIIHPLDANNVYFIGNLADMNIGAPIATPDTFSGHLFIEGYPRTTGRIQNVQVKDNILIGQKALGGYYSIGSSNNVASLKVNDNIMEDGRTATYYTYPNLAGLSVTTPADYAGNTDWATGAPLTYIASQGFRVSGSAPSPTQPIPVAPTGLSAAAISSGQVNLVWNSVSGATSYTLERSTNSTTGFSLVTTTSGTSYQDTSVVANTTYYYRLKATNSAGDSAYSAIVSATPQTANQIPVASTDVTAGLIARYPFDGNATDSVGTSNGTIAGNPSFVTGRIGSQALNFDGVDDTVNMGSTAALTNLGPYSLLAWVKPTNTTGGYIISSRSSFPGYWRLAYEANVLRWFKDTSGTNHVQADSSAGVLPVGSWSHVALTWDGTVNGSGVTMYVNGTAISITTTNGEGSVISDAGNIFSVGSRGGTSSFFNGTIDDVRIYNRALSLSEVQAIYNQPSARNRSQQQVIANTLTSLLNTLSELIKRLSQ